MHYIRQLTIIIMALTLNSGAFATLVEVSANLGSVYPTTDDAYVSLSRGRLSATGSATDTDLFVQSTAGNSGTSVSGAGAKVAGVTFNVVPVGTGPVDLLLNFDFNMFVHSPGPDMLIFDQAGSMVRFNIIAQSMQYQNVGGSVTDTAGAYGHSSRSRGMFADLFDDYDYTIDPIANPGFTDFPDFSPLDYSGTLIVPIRVSDLRSEVRLTTVIGTTTLAIGDSGAIAELSMTTFDSDFITYADGSVFDGEIIGAPEITAVPVPATLGFFLSGVIALVALKACRRPKLR